MERLPNIIPASLMAIALLSLSSGCDRAAPLPAVGTNSSTSSLHTIDITIKGMHCEACVDAISATVAAMPGVDSIQVLLDEEVAHINLSADANTQAIITAIDDLGYHASMTE
ncbi:MAG: heavy-metal-associated domain-containing protein [Phycisphaerales bacterium]